MLKAIACVDNRMNIGKGNDLLFHISADMKHFKELTTGHTVIMGYNTWESLPNKPLKDRTNVVLTMKDIEIPGVKIYHNADQAVGDYWKSDEEAWVIGGAIIYKTFLPYCNEIYLTKVYYSSDDADKRFEWNDFDWQLIDATEYTQDEKSKLYYSFCHYKRRVY